MFIILLEHKLLTGLISFFLLVSLISQIIAGVIYHNMISESDNMPDTENKHLKQCKQKYADYYKLNGKMTNTSVFVEKYLQGISFAKIRLGRFDHISGQFMMLSILTAGISICLSLAAGSTLFQIIPYYLISILEVYLYFSISGIVDAKEKRRMLIINITDYLENYYAPRLETEKENAMLEGIKKREKYGQEYLREEEERKKEELSASSDAELQPVMNQYQEELENLLEEFFA